MAVLSSSSALIAFDELGYNTSDLLYQYLNQIQNLNLSFNSKFRDKNFIGNTQDKYLFDSPEVTLELNYIQNPSLLNEQIFGFDIDSSVAAKKSGLSSIFNGFKNKNAIIIFDDNNYASDLAIKISKNNFSTDLVIFNLGDLFLQNYSLSYSYGLLPQVQCSFISSQLKVSNPYLRSEIYYFLDNYSREINLTTHKENITDKLTVEDIRAKRGDLVTLTVKNFSISSTLNNISIPGLNRITSLQDSIVKSLNLNFEIERENIYEISTNLNFSENKCTSRPISNAINAKLNISGTSLTFSKTDINLFINSINIYKGFDISININNDQTALIFPTKTNAVIEFKNLKVENFSYDLGLDGTLNYQLSCSFKIDDQIGFFIQASSPIDETDVDLFLSTDNQLLLSKDRFVLGPTN